MQHFVIPRIAHYFTRISRRNFVSIWNMNQDIFQRFINVYYQFWRVYFSWKEQNVAECRDFLHCEKCRKHFVINFNFKNCISNVSRHHCARVRLPCFIVQQFGTHNPWTLAILLIGVKGFEFSLKVLIEITGDHWNCCYFTNHLLTHSNFAYLHVNLKFE